jgi:hypothetical protein
MTSRSSRYLRLSLVGAVTLITVPALAEGPDVILGRLQDARIYATHDGTVAITVGTTSCNAGDQVLEWRQLPSNRHPVISMNMYRLTNEGMSQIGQSWVKHGFIALQQNICGFGCQPNPTGGGLGVGCSDPYGALTNQGPNLGSRGEINPFTGFYDGATVNKHNDEHSTGIEHGLQVKEADLLTPGARFFIEGHYITPDDAGVGNGHNNVSHMEVFVERDANGAITIRNPPPGPPTTIRETPAIMAWPYAQFAIHDPWPDDGRIIVGYKVTRLTRTKFRYSYAVYNLNSARPVREFSIPVDEGTVQNPGFGAVASHGEPWSTAPWSAEIANGRLTWSTANGAGDANSNVIRWGTTYNFWFDASSAPVLGDSSVSYLVPGEDNAEFTVRLLMPES